MRCGFLGKSVYISSLGPNVNNNNNNSNYNNNKNPAKDSDYYKKITRRRCIMVSSVKKE